jgi:hypothetical protein
MQNRERAELVAAISEVFEIWQKAHGLESCAIRALDALGFTAGAIFAQAPDEASKQNGRDQFMAAIDEGMSGVTLVDRAEIN